MEGEVEQKQTGQRHSTSFVEEEIYFQAVKLQLLVFTRRYLFFRPLRMCHEHTWVYAP